MDDPSERIRSSVRKFYEKDQAAADEKRASDVLRVSGQQARDNFASDVENVILPTLHRMKDDIDSESPESVTWGVARDRRVGALRAEISSPQGKDRVTFLLIGGPRHAGLVFTLNAAEGCVRITCDSFEWETTKKNVPYRYRRQVEVSDGTGREARTIVNMPLHQINISRVEEVVAAFIDEVLGAAWGRRDGMVSLDCFPSRRIFPRYADSFSHRFRAAF